MDAADFSADGPFPFLPGTDFHLYLTLSIGGLLSRDFTILVLVAFIIAAPAAYYLVDQWWLQSFAYRLDLGMGPFALAGIVSLLIAWLTVGYHAAKIVRMNPVETLKYE